MAVVAASEARAKLHGLIEQVAQSHQPIHIAGRRTSAVLVSMEDWAAVQETLCLLSSSGKRESIKEGMAEALAHSVCRTGAHERRQGLRNNNEGKQA